eukprot:TRINITY_DN5220_c0_g1_i5.p1 TRINITY_DN5220_c0_g1~~TRINITY_DN5220_c0_g1_i5.p1  ORF type:complete len:399 (-),score=69.97 TRINITY_DN5220_c0_g1_i5:84-1280(-)
METELLKEGLITQQSSRWAEKVDGDFSGFVNMKMRAVLGEVRAIVLNYDFELQPQEPLIFSDHKQRSPYTKQFLESLPYLSFNPFHRDGSNSDVFSTSPFEFPKYLVSKSANSIVKAIQSVIQDAQQQTSPRCDEIYKLGRTTLSLLKVLLQSKTSKSLTDGPKQSMILALDSLYVSHFITVTSLLQHSRYGDYNDISVSLGEIGRRTIRSAIDKVGSQALNQLSAARAYEQSPRGSKFDSFRNNTTGSSKCITIISSACIGWMDLMPDHLFQATVTELVDRVCDYFVEHVLSQPSITKSESSDWCETLSFVAAKLQSDFEACESKITISDLQSFKRLQTLADFMVESLETFSSVFDPDVSPPCPFTRREVANLVVSLFKESENRRRVLSILETEESD